LRAAEAEHETDADRRAELERAAAEARALADVLDDRGAELEQADEIRARWYANTAETRAAADRARDELACRGIDPDQSDLAITAEEWLGAHTAEQLAEDPHRQITDEADLAEIIEQRDADIHAVDTELAAEVPETNVADIRDETADEPQQAARTADDWARVPTAQETADSISRAQRALAELEQRYGIDERRAAQEARTQQLGHWHAERNARELDASDHLDRSR
jgi:hypothetical protein